MAVWCLAVAWFAAPEVSAQDLTPRAYLITPTGSHAVILSSSFSKGDILSDPTVPIEDAKGSFQTAVLGYAQSFNLFGRSSNVTLVLPYAHGNFEGTVAGSQVQAYRSGLGDARVRFSINLHGGPAMDVGEYLKWREKTVIGVSLTAVVPNGQYDPQKLVNIGANRWGVKPEIGFSRRWGSWAVDCYTGVWFFSRDRAYYPGQSLRTQNPIGAVESHAGYYFKPRLWVSFDMNFWTGGRSTVNGVEKQGPQQRDSRAGGNTVAATQPAPVAQVQLQPGCLRDNRRRLSHD